MFGNMNTDEILKAIKEGKELFVAGSAFTQENVKGSKVSRASIGDFLKGARARSRRSNPIVPNMADYVNWVLYDRIIYAAGATIPQLFKLFVAPIGSGTKTKVDTNLELVSSLPAPQWYNVTGISLFFNSNVAPVDAVSFLNTTYMEFWVSQKVYAEGPVDVFPSSGGLFMQNSTNLTAGSAAYVTNTNNGWPSYHNMWDTRLPAGLALGTSGGQNVVADGIIGITILQSQTFNMQFKADGGGITLAAGGATPIAGTGITVSARLHGILSRGVA
jgi:hypothetical protein